MLETALVRCDPGEYDWHATAVRCHPYAGEPWHVFVSMAGEDRHLTPLEADTRPGEFVIEGLHSVLAKLVVLFGRPWSEVWEDMLGVVGFQARALDALTDKFLEQVNATPLDEIREWTIGMQSLSEGEYLRAAVTGENPLSLRN